MVRATCCICLQHKPDLLPWTRVWRTKCCNALYCTLCAQQWREVSDICPHCRARPERPRVETRVWSWQETCKWYLACVATVAVFVTFIVLLVAMTHPTQPVFKRVPSGPMTGPVGHKGPPGERFDLRGPTGFPGPQGPPGMCGGPVGPLG